MGRGAHRGRVTPLGDRIAWPRSTAERRVLPGGGMANVPWRQDVGERAGEAEDGWRRAPWCGLAGPTLGDADDRAEALSYPGRRDGPDPYDRGSGRWSVAGLQGRAGPGRPSGRGHRRSRPEGPETAENDARVWLGGVRASKIPRGEAIATLHYLNLPIAHASINFFCRIYTRQAFFFASIHAVESPSLPVSRGRCRDRVLRLPAA